MKEDNKQFYSAFKSKSEVISSSWKDFIDQEWVSYYGFEAIPIPSIISVKHVRSKICSLIKH